jgi:hypothetical protein
MMLLPDPRCARRDVDDDPVAAFLEQGREGADCRERAADVRGQHPVDQIVIERVEVAMRHRAGEAGGIDQHVAAAELLLHRGGGLVDLRGVFERQAHRLMTRASERREHRVGAVDPLVVAEDDLGAGFREKPGAGCPDPARRARHHGDLARQISTRHRYASQVQR